MARMYDYRVCQVQQQCITFVNGEWAGRVPLTEAAGASDPFASCPKVWDYLQRVGPDGWELVAVQTHQTSVNLQGNVSDGNLTAALTPAGYELLYLKREL